MAVADRCIGILCRVALFTAASLAAAAGAYAASSAGVKAFERKNYAKAIDKLTPEAGQGDAEAQYYLALSLRGSLPTRKGASSIEPDESDPGQRAAHDWMMKAAAQGYVKAWVEVAEAFNVGAGTPVDYPAALEWIQKAADSGDARGRARLAAWYRSGNIVAPDLTKAAALSPAPPVNEAEFAARIAASRPKRDIRRLFIPEQQGLDKYSDEELAVGGDPRAALRVADLARVSGREGNKDCAAALPWYERAGQFGLASGFHQLGIMYYRGECVPQDFAKAQEALRRAAAVGYAPAHARLGRMALFGHGQSADYVAAYVHLKAAQRLESDKTEAARSPTLDFAIRQLAPEQRLAAEQAYAALEPELQALRTKRSNPLLTAAGGMKIRSGAIPATYQFSFTDYTGQCFGNHLDECIHAPLEVDLEVRHQESATLVCKLELAFKLFPSMQATVLDRRYVLWPPGNTTLRLGSMAGAWNFPDSIFGCERIEQPSVANDTCVIRLPANVRPQPVYPSKSRSNGEQGDITLWVTVTASGKRPTQVELQESSGFTRLDESALSFARGEVFETNCPGERLRYGVSFRLED